MRLVSAGCLHLHSRPLGLIAQSKLRPREGGAKCQPLVFANAGQKSNLLTSVSLAGALCQLTFLFAATKYPTQSNLRDGLFWLSGGGDSPSWWQEMRQPVTLHPLPMRQRDKWPCLACFLFTQSRTPAHGRVPPAFQAGLPA